jgi:hypothetical protein
MSEKMLSLYYINYLRYVYCSASLLCLNKLSILSMFNVQYLSVVNFGSQKNVVVLYKQ